MRGFEFERGDTVTFNAYHDEEIAAKVVELISIFDEPKYRLEGISKGLVTMTSGRCIIESVHYVKPPVKFDWS